MDHLRSHSPAHLAAGSMSTPAAVQTASALEVIMGRDGSSRGAAKLAQLRDNANYMRRRLTEMGCLVLGDYDSPVLVRPPVACPSMREAAPLLSALLPLTCHAKFLTGPFLRSMAETCPEVFRGKSGILIRLYYICASTPGLPTVLIEPFLCAAGDAVPAHEDCGHQQDVPAAQAGHRGGGLPSSAPDAWAHSALHLCRAHPQGYRLGP